MVKDIILLATLSGLFTLNNKVERPAEKIAGGSATIAVTISDTIIKVNAEPAAGFNYPYYIRIPKGLKQEEIQMLLVETNNSGVNDTFAYHERVTYSQVAKKSLGSNLCSELKIPFLMPVFPRPATEWKYYTHALDRDVALLKHGNVKRLDLQLIAMVAHAKKVLKEKGVNIKDKFLLNGFSASGTFANRFTLLHPELVAGTACGGINAIPILPVATLEKKKLNYPIGTNDLKQVFGIDMNMEAYKKIPQFIYMGEKDDNDAVMFDDAYSKAERKLILKLLGKELVPQRFKKCESVYVGNNINSRFRIYEGTGHATDQKIFRDVYGFFKNIIDDK